ncbi:MAG: thioredoxin fold domain-containing protein [Chthonomonadales bacterium]
MKLNRIVLLSALTATVAGTQVARADIGWKKNYNDAVASAKAGNKLIMIDFYTDWCVWCKRLDKDTYSDKHITQLASSMAPVKINAEKEGVALAKKYKVAGFPTILFLNADGDVEGKIGGYMPPEAFGAEMEKFQKSHVELPKMRAAIQKDPHNVAAAAFLAGNTAGKGEKEQAEKYLAVVVAGDPTNKSGHTAEAYNAVGDMYQEHNSFDKAIGYFSKAAAVGKTPKDLAYANMSIAACDFSLNKPKEARAAVNAALKIKGVPADLVGNLQQMDAALKKAGK